eukprot:SAG22_NODE_342_length_11973_cov_10.127927_1_plen_25_part_10
MYNDQGGLRATDRALQAATVDCNPV